MSLPDTFEVGALPVELPLCPKMYEPFGVPATVSNCTKLAAPQRKRSAVLALGVHEMLLVKVTVHSVEAPFVKPPERTVVGEQLQVSERLGAGTVELTFWQLHFDGVPGRTSVSLLHTPPVPISFSFWPQVAQVGISTKPSAAPFVPSKHLTVMGSGKIMKESSQRPSELASQVALP